MTYAAGRTYYDADSHIMELPDFLAEFAEPSEREQMPKINVPSVPSVIRMFAGFEIRK